MIKIEKWKKLAYVLNSDDMIKPIVFLSVVLGLCLMFSYMASMDSVSQDVSYENSFFVPSEAVSIKEFSEIKINFSEGKENLYFGSEENEILISSIVLTETQFKGQNFSRYYYIIEYRNTGTAKINSRLYGVGREDIYLTTSSLDAEYIIAKENRFGPFNFFKLEPSYNIINLEYNQTGEFVNFIASLEFDKGEAIADIIVLIFILGTILICVAIFVADILLYGLIIIAICIVERDSTKNKTIKPEK